MQECQQHAAPNRITANVFIDDFIVTVRGNNPNAIVQIFSARWNKIDEVFSWPVAILHGLLLGTLHR